MSLATSMNVVEITEFGPPRVLRPARRPVPAPSTGEVLIKVEGIGVCRPDSLQRRGLHPPPAGASDIPGLEVAGTIVALGDDVPGWKPDDKVCALLAGGGYAEYATAPHQQVLPLPANWSCVEAATLPENAFTIWDNVFHRARLAPGETLLVHGGASGLGSLAIMLARAFGAEAIATAGTDAKCKACLQIGARYAINYRSADFVAAVMDHTRGRGANVIIDIVGGEYVQRSLEALAVEGRLVHLSTQSADKRATINMNTLIHRRGTIIASHLRSRSPREKGMIAKALQDHVWPKLPARDPVAPLIDSVHPLEDAAKVHEYFDAGAHTGKIVLVP